MRRRAIIFLVIFLAIIFQISVLPNFFAAASAPNLVLMLVIFWVAQNGFDEALRRSVLAGFLADLTTFSAIGLHIFSFLAASFGVSFLVKRFLVTHAAWRFFIMLMLIAAGTFLNDFFIAIVLKAATWIKSAGADGYGIMFSEALALKIFYSLVFFMILYWPLLKLEKFFALTEQRVNFKK